MSVFTPVTRPELETFLAPYELGRLLDFQGIAAGTENSNFFVSLEQGEFVLTLVERGPVWQTTISGISLYLSSSPIRSPSCAAGILRDSGR